MRGPVWYKSGKQSVRLVLRGYGAPQRRSPAHVRARTSSLATGGLDGRDDGGRAWQKEGDRQAQALAAQGAAPGDGGAARTRGAAPPAPLVDGDVSDGRGLLLHA